MPRNQPHCGFTLAELMVTVALIAVTLALAVPSMQNYLHKMRLKYAAETLYQKTQLLREEAFRQQSNAFVTFQTTSNWCVGYTIGSNNCDCNTPATCHFTVVNSHDFAGVSLATQSTYWQFEGTRGTRLAGNDLTLSIDNLSITLKTMRMGRSYLCSSSVKGYPAC